MANGQLLFCALDMEHVFQHANNFPLYIVHDTMHEIEDSKKIGQYHNIQLKLLTRFKWKLVGVMPTARPQYNYFLCLMILPFQFYLNAQALLGHQTQP